MNRLRQVEPQCLSVSFSKGDLTVVMETHCKSTKEVTDDIDMTNIFFSDFCPRFPPLPFSFIHVAHVFEKLSSDIVSLSSPPVSHCSFHSFPPCSCPFFSLSKRVCMCVRGWVCLCESKNVNSMSLCSLLRYQ